MLGIFDNEDHRFSLVSFAEELQMSLPGQTPLHSVYSECLPDIFPENFRTGSRNHTLCYG